MARPFIRAVLVASVVSGAMAAGSAPAAAAGVVVPDGEWPYAYARCYDIEVAAGGIAPVITVCSPV